MERKILLTVVVLTLAALALAILLPGGRSIEQNPKLPWVISIDQGFPMVFGLTIGKSTPGVMYAGIFRNRDNQSVCLSDRQLAVETYFKASIWGIKADMVCNPRLTTIQLDRIYDQGLRIQPAGKWCKEGSSLNKNLSSSQDYRAHHPYPSADLTEDLIRNRFGEPSGQTAEESGIVHWLYPEKDWTSLSIRNGRKFFQYVAISFRYSDRTSRQMIRIETEFRFLPAGR